LDCHHVCKTCAFHDALQAGKQKEIYPPYSTDLAPAREVRWVNFSKNSQISNFVKIRPMGAEFFADGQT
jgi:hypothetical protein